MRRSKCTMGRNSLEDLPQDCWVQVLDQLSQSDTASVGATSRGLRMSSEESLYRRVEIDWKIPPLRRVLALFRVVHQRPDVAAHIRHVSMIPSRMEYPTDDSEDEWEPPLIDGDWKELAAFYHEDVAAARKIVIRAQFPAIETWIHALENGNPYAFVAVLLSQLPNLQSLRLDYSFVWQSGFPGLMIRHALLSAPPDTLSRFSHLALVEYGLNVPGPRLFNETRWNYIDAFPICDPDQFAGWFYLPSLRSLEIWLQTFQGVRGDLQKLPGAGKLAHLANLDRLVLTHASVEEDEVRDLLFHLSSVKSVHLGIVYPSQDKDAGFYQVSPQPPLRKKGVLLEGLMSIKDTVEHISLSLELCPIFFTTHWLEEKHGVFAEALLPFQGFLKQFPLLQTAEIPPAILFGWDPDSAPNMADVLPAKLQKLCLRGDMQCVADYQWEMDVVAEAIQGFLPQAESATPMLKTIQLRLFNPDDPVDWGQEHAEAARSPCTALGLDIDITMNTDSLSPGLWTTSRELGEYVHRGR